MGPHTDAGPPTECHQQTLSASLVVISPQRGVAWGRGKGFGQGGGGGGGGEGGEERGGGGYWLVASSIITVEPSAVTYTS